MLKAALHQTKPNFCFLQKAHLPLKHSEEIFIFSGQKNLKDKDIMQV